MKCCISKPLINTGQTLKLKQLLLLQMSTQRVADAVAQEAAAAADVHAAQSLSLKLEKMLLCIGVCC